MKSSNGLIAAILVAAVLISGSLVFLGTKGGCVDDELQAAVIAGLTEFTTTGPRQEEPEPTIIEGDYTDDDAVLGDADAPVTIVEFSEFQCPYCSRFYADAYQGIKENYVATGKVKIVFRDYPLDFHAGAYPAALAAECVREQGGDDMYFAMHNKIFENQGILSGEAEAVSTGLAGFAGEVGANLDAYNECVAADTYKDEILADLSDGQSIGVSGTPSFLINGLLLVGAQPYEVFETAIEDALNQ